jgi:hypothetical protein
MTTAQKNLKAAELDAAADMLDSALLAPSMKSSTLRREAEMLREAAKQEEAAAEYGRLARMV